jgi:hypothetical protein
MKYYGIFVGGKLAHGFLDCFPQVWSTRKDANDYAKSDFDSGEYEIAEVRITRVPKAKKAKASKK